MAEEQVVIDLTTPPEGADRAADAARRFLLERGVARENDAPDPLWQGAELVPGDAWAEAVEEGARADRRWLLQLGTGVEVIAGQRGWGAEEALACPRCGADPEDGGTDLLLAAEERIVTSAACGRRSRLRKWRAGGGGAAGAVAVRFEGWPPLDPAFTDELAAALGAGDVAIVRRG